MYLSKSSKKNSPNILFTEKKFKLSRFGSPNWVNEYKTINNRFYEVKSIKQGVTEQICDLSALRLRWALFANFQDHHTSRHRSYD